MLLAISHLSLKEAQPYQSWLVSYKWVNSMVSNMIFLEESCYRSLRTVSVEYDDNAD